MKPIKHLVVVFIALYVVVAANMLFVHNLITNSSSISLGVVGQVNASTLGTTSDTIAVPTKVILPTSTPFPSATPTPVPVGDPTTISIPKIGIDTTFVNVGVTTDNVMETPQDYNTVGWYINGARPGEIGAAIINGHFDDVSGNEAVFFNLSKLKTGDEIIVKTTLGKSMTFVVESSYSQEYASFPKELIYAPYDGRGLKLITCDGIWNAKEKTYSKRLVVSARLIEPK